MTSYRGPNGGVSLAKPGEQIKIMEIVEAIDGPKLFTDCIMGLPNCGDQEPTVSVAGARDIEDTGNAWVLIYIYEFHSNNA